MLNQTFTDFELLIYDDGSTDNSREIIKSFDDPRIKTFLYEENRGPRLAVKECIDAAKGKYIAIHHSDDTWSADKLAKQVEFLDDHEEYAACFTLADFIDEEGNPQTLDEGDFYATIFDKPNRSRAEWLNHFFYRGNCLCHPSVLIRRECYAKYNLLDFQGLWQLPDYFMWVNLCFHENFYIMHEKLVKFRLRLKSRDNVSASTFDRRIRGESEMYFVLDNFVKNFHDDKFFLEVFPNAKKFLVDGKINRNFAFAQICLENSDTPFSGIFQLTALKLLKKILTNNKTANEIKTLYNYDEKTFLRDTGNIDVFNLAQKLSLPHGILYFDCGEGFNADAMIDRYIFLEESGNFYTKYFFNAVKPVKKIRFDPDEDFISVKLDAFTVNGENLSVTGSNADEVVDGLYNFMTNDPQIYFDVEDLIGNLTVEVRGRVDKNYSKILNENIAQLQTANSQLQQKNLSLDAQIKNLQTVNKNLDDYNEELKNANTVISQYNSELENANQILTDNKNELERQLEIREEKISNLTAQIEEFKKLKETLLNSRSWKVTAPLRKLGDLFRKMRSDSEGENSDTNLKVQVYRKLTDPKVRSAVHKVESVCEEKFPSIHEKILLPTKSAAKAALLKFASSNKDYTSGVHFWNLSKKKFEGLVSVIVPNYNHAKYLRQRLETIYNQTYKNFEVILLDDASTDDSREILNEFYEAHKDNTRKIFNEENSGGVFNQWQRGIESARGSLIWIAESDDYCTENFLESLVDAFTDDAVELAFARTDFIQDGLKTFTSDEYLSDITAFDWKKTFAVSAADFVEHALGVKNVIPNVSGVIFRKPELIREKFRDLWKSMKLCGDWLFYLDIIKGGVVCYNPNATNFYRIHKNSTSLKIQKQPRYYEEGQIIAEFVSENYNVTPSVHERHFNQLKEHFFSYYGGTDIEELKKYFNVEKILSVQRKPNILMCVFALTIGGGETYPLILANEYRRKGYPITVLNFQMEEEYLGIRQRLTADVPLINLTQTAGVDEVIELFKIDIVHSHHGSVDEALSHFVEKRPELRHVVTLHGMYEITAEVHLKHMLKRADISVDKFVYTANKNLNSFKSHGWKIDDRFIKIGNGLEYSTGTPIPRSELNIPEDAFVCCTVSRAIPEKGWESAIKAVTIANEKSPRRIDLVLVGSGEMYDKLKGKVPDFVHLAGFRSNVRDYFAMSDIGLLPSEFLGESFPFMFIDCLFAGRPLVASNLGDCEEVLTLPSGDMAGIIFNLNENNKVPPETLAKILVTLANDKAEYKKILDRVPEVAKKFFIENVADEYIKVYKSVMANKRM